MRQETAESCGRCWASIVSELWLQSEVLICEMLFGPPSAVYHVTPIGDSEDSGRGCVRDTV